MAPAASIRTLAAGRYRLLEPLGEGGMATVYRAVDTQPPDPSDTMRAVKVLHGKWVGRPKTRQRLENEAAVMMDLPHPHVVQVHGLYSAEAEVFIIMELLAGGSVWDLVLAHGQLPPQGAVDLCLQVLDALTLAHDNGIVHRDIKPHNVLLTLEGKAKVTDFGIARLEDSGLTRTGAVMGTLAYMPPEQKLSARKVDARSDLYAVGAMLWACLTGREPHDLYAAGMDEAVATDYLEEVPDVLREVILTATRFSPEARYPHAGAMRDALQTARSALPPDPRGLVDLLDQDRAQALCDPSSTPSDVVLPRGAASTYPDEAAALTPILPPRRLVASVPEAPQPPPSRIAVAGGIGLLVLAALLVFVGFGLVGSVAMGTVWLQPGDTVAVEAPTPALAVPASAPEPPMPVDAVPVATPAPDAAAAPEPEPAAPEPEPVQATAAPDPAPAPAHHRDDGAAAVAEPAPEEPAPVPARVVKIVPTEVEPEPPPAPAPSQAPAPVASGGWEATSMPGAGGRVTVVLTLKSDRSVTTAGGSTGHPKLVLVCSGKRSRAFFDPGVATEMVLSETGMDASFAKVVVNGEAHRMHPDDTAEQTALTLRPSKKWIRQLRGGGRFTFAFLPFGSDPTEVSFPVSGLDALMTERFDPYCKT